MIKNYSGRLELNESNNYIVKDMNISEELNRLYMNEIPATYSLFVDGNVKFNEQGVLYKKKNIGLLYDYNINGINIENELFELVGEVIDFDIRVGAKNT